MWRRFLAWSRRPRQTVIQFNIILPDNLPIDPDALRQTLTQAHGSEMLSVAAAALRSSGVHGLGGAN
jgi:hypothetical protein